MVNCEERAGLPLDEYSFTLNVFGHRFVNIRQNSICILVFILICVFLLFLLCGLITVVHCAEEGRARILSCGRPG